MQTPKRFALVGTGARGLEMYARPLLTQLTSHAHLVALCDINPMRIKAANSLLGASLPGYTELDDMLARVELDGVIIASRDDVHARQVIRCLQHGLRVYCEKPLCITADQCGEIAAVAAASAGQCFVTHNARYNPARQVVKEIVDSGRLGRIQHVEFRENLDRHHGADYFRRWHKHKRSSGGLLIHKASHHFDFINWLIGSRPRQLRATGGTYTYGSAGPFRGQRCLGCSHAHECDFHVDLSKDPSKQMLYFQAEHVDGYLRDACVFDPTIDVEDHLSVLYDYECGTRVNYTLTAYASFEGDSISLQGTQGRLEYENRSTSDAIAPSAATSMASYAGRGRLMVFDHHNRLVEEVTLPPITSGSHGGADSALQRDFFMTPWDAPRPHQMASLDEAIQAILIGHAGNMSIANHGQAIDVQSLLFPSATGIQ